MVAIGVCADDTVNVDAIYPVMPARNHLGHEGFAVYCWSEFSQQLEAAVWRETRWEAVRDRNSLLEA